MKIMQGPVDQWTSRTSEIGLPDLSPARLDSNVNKSTCFSKFEIPLFWHVTGDVMMTLHFIAKHDFYQNRKVWPPLHKIHNSYGFWLKMSMNLKHDRICWGWMGKCDVTSRERSKFTGYLGPGFGKNLGGEDFFRLQKGGEDFFFNEKRSFYFQMK